jgi:lysophospholipase L1-like esterase
LKILLADFVKFIFILAVTIMMGEILLRLTRPDIDFFYVLFPYQRKVFHHKPGLMPGTSSISSFRTNAQGIRAREFSSKDFYRILAVGCSVTLCEFVDQAKTWPAVLENILNEKFNRKIWVGCIGKDTITSRDLITMTKYFLPQLKDKIDVVIMMTGVNDMALMLSKGSNYDPDYLEHVSIDRQLMRVFCKLPRKYSNLAFSKRLAIWALFSCLKQNLQSSHYLNATAFYLQKRERRQRTTKLIRKLPDIHIGVEEYIRNINKIIDYTKDSYRLIFMTHPTLWRNDLTEHEQDLLWFGWTSDQSRYYAPSVLAQAIALYNHSLLEVCCHRGVECIDLAAALPKNTTVLYDDVHLNENGCRQIGLILNNYFEKITDRTKSPHLYDK